MMKLKRKIKRVINKIRYSESKKYIIFVAIVVPILIFFILSRFIFGEEASNRLNYNVKVTLTDYNIKISYAAYNTDTNSFECTWFMMPKNTATVSSSQPEIYSIAVDTDLDTFIEYDTAELSSTAQQIMAKNVPKSFNYVRIFFMSKNADTVVPDRYDDFGDLIEGYTIDGETEYLEVRIDIKDIQIINNEAALTSTYVTFEQFDEEETTVSPTVTVKDTTTTIPTDTVTTETETTANTVTNTTTSTTTAVTTTPQASVTSTSTTAKTSTVSTTPKKTATTTKSEKTTKATTTTPKKTTTQATTTTTGLKYVALRGLKIGSSPVATNGSITLEVNGTAQLYPIFTPEDVTYKAVKWTSKNTDVAVVDSSGKVTAVGKGSVIIKCTTIEGEIFEVGIMIKVI